jgi:hypothetical protein
VQHIPQIHILNFNHKYLITPHSHDATIMLPCCRHAALMRPPPPLYCRRHPKLPRCCRHTAATATLLPPPRCCLCCHIATKLLSLPLPPHRCHCHRRCQAATAATKLPPLPLSTLQDRFDNEKEFCKMTDIDFVRLS